MIKHFSKCNAEYFHIYASWPVCNSEPTNWIHEHCGGDMYIGDDGYCYCESCGERKPAIQWTYQCPECGPGTAGMHSMKIDCQLYVAPVQCLAGQMTNECGVVWLNKFTASIMEQCKNV